MEKRRASIGDELTNLSCSNTPTFASELKINRSTEPSPDQEIYRNWTIFIGKNHEGTNEISQDDIFNECLSQEYSPSKKQVTINTFATELKINRSSEPSPDDEIYNNWLVFIGNNHEGSNEIVSEDVSERESYSFPENPILSSVISSDNSTESYDRFEEGLSQEYCSSHEQENFEEDDSLKEESSSLEFVSLYSWKMDKFLQREKLCLKYINLKSSQGKDNLKEPFSLQEVCFSLKDKVLNCFKSIYFQPKDDFSLEYICLTQFYAPILLYFEKSDCISNTLFINQYPIAEHLYSRYIPKSLFYGRLPLPNKYKALLSHLSAFFLSLLDSSKKRLNFFGFYYITYDNHNITYAGKTKYLYYTIMDFI